MVHPDYAWSVGRKEKQPFTSERFEDIRRNLPIGQYSVHGKKVYGAGGHTFVCRAKTELAAFAICDLLENLSTFETALKEKEVAWEKRLANLDSDIG